MQAKQLQATLKLPFLTVSGTWDVQETELAAAWDLYVELITRISTVPLAQDDGLLREALSSLHSLFGITRGILRHHGRAVAQAKTGHLSFGVIAVAVLNAGIRPFVGKWHPDLEDYEGHRPRTVSRREHERQWDQAVQMRKELDELREVLVQYAKLLEEALSLDGVDVSLLWRGGGE